MFFFQHINTGKSSEALIFASTNPQYEDRLFIELHRDCFPKFANGLNIKRGIAQKVYGL